MEVSGVALGTHDYELATTDSFTGQTFSLSISITVIPDCVSMTAKANWAPPQLTQAIYKPDNV